MTIGHPSPAIDTRSVTSRIELGLQALTAYAVPALVALLTVWAVLSWPSEYPEGEGRLLPFRAMTVDTPRTPEQVLAALPSQPERTSWDTRLSEQPLWVLLTLSDADRADGRALDFPSRA